MNQPDLRFESNHKKLGILRFDGNSLDIVNGPRFRSSIKVLFVPAGYRLTVDFHEYNTENPTLFFVNSNQFLTVENAGKAHAWLIHYNRDFYCVQIHDAEVACDGLLFNNLFENPSVALNKDESAVVTQLFEQMIEELQAMDASSEEMIRTYLKQVIIRATRQWKRQNLESEHVPLPTTDLEFFRNFSRLVDIHFREKHAVSDYAELLNIAPKTLSSKFNKLRLQNPNEAIKNRIVLEAKRLLVYTDLSVKEIAYWLGYDDPAYFNRMFAQKTAIAPAGFRKRERHN